MTTELDHKLISEIASATGLPRVLAELVILRGYDSVDKALRFLNPDMADLSSPYALNGMREGVNLINKHIPNGKILIFGDYDCDGIGASAILSLALKDHGANVDVFIPTRIEDGYGLTEDALARAYEKFSPTLLITVDCGIGSVDEIEAAHRLGIDTLITDHHEPTEVLPDSVIINPKTQIGASELCGAGVAYMLTRALYGDEYAKRFIDICAVSTIADLVPLTGDNRIIAANGLKVLSSNKVRYGLKVLMELSGHRFGKYFKAGDVSFKLAPRLNASGRLSSAYKSYRLLTTDDKALARELAVELDNENRERQELCSKTINEARRMLLDYDLTHNRIIVLHNSEWEPGVIGIAAAKIAEEFRRPTIFFSCLKGVLKGSCRSIKGINIYEVLTSAKEAIIQYGGHTMAAGLSIKPENMDKFISIANAYIKANYPDEFFKPPYEYDAEVTIRDLNLSFVHGLEKLEPYGMGNSRPIFKTDFRRMNFERIKKPHIKCRLNPNSELIAYNCLEYKETLGSPLLKSIFFTVDKEEFHGKESIRCLYKGMRLHEVVPAEGEVFASLAEKYLPKRNIVPISHVDCGYDKTFGRLLITFSNATLAALRAEYPDYAVAMGCLSGVNPYNTILIAPAINNNYGYYSVIEVYDTPPKAYIDDLRREYTAEIIVHNNAVKYNSSEILINREKLLGIFSFIKAYAKDKEFESVYDLYYLLSEKGYSAPIALFETGYYILSEIGVVYIDNNNKVCISNDKKDLAESKILKLINDGNL